MTVSETHAHQYALYALAGVTGFVCGAYFQQETSIRNLFCVIKKDPNVFQHRHKLYPILSTFKTDHESRLWERSPRFSDKIRDSIMSPLYDILSYFLLVKEARIDPPNLMELIKYGLPSTDNLSVHKDYVVSHDVRTNSAYWLCEHLTNDGNQLGSRKSGEDLNLRFNDVYVLSSGSAGICKAFKSKIWYALEQYVSEMTKNHGSVYAYTGPMYCPVCRTGEDWHLEYQIVDWIPVPVPSHFFKVLIIDSQLPESKPYMEGYIIPNRANCSSTDLRRYLSDIAEIERYTGLSFANGLRHNVLFDNYKIDTTTHLDSFQELTEKLVRINHVCAEDYF